MDGNGIRLSAALIAATAAGPVFLTAWFAAELYLRLPAPVSVDPVQIVQFVLILIPSVIFGVLLAIAPLMIGTLLMSACAERWEAARSARAWAGAGAAAGGGLVLQFGAGGPAAFALVVTSAVCAWLAHGGVEF